MGMCDELYSFYEQIKLFTGVNFTRLVGSGNGIRNNKVLQYYLKEKFGMPLKIPENNEEAAFGAAYFAGGSSQRNPQNRAFGGKGGYFQQYNITAEH